MRLRRLVFAGCLFLLAAPAGAVEPPPGTKNFTSPTSTPDYFSGEGGAFRGAAPRPTAPAAAPVVTAPVAAPVLSAPRSRGEAVEERRYPSRRYASHATARRGHARYTRREAAVRRRAGHQSVHAAVRGRTLSHRTVVVHARTGGHRSTAPRGHAAVPAKSRKIARAGR